MDLKQRSKPSTVKTGVAGSDSVHPEARVEPVTEPPVVRVHLPRTEVHFSESDELTSVIATEPPDRLTRRRPIVRPSLPEVDVNVQASPSPTDTTLPATTSYQSLTVASVGDTEWSEEKADIVRKFAAHWIYKTREKMFRVRRAMKIGKKWLTRTRSVHVPEPVDFAREQMSEEDKKFAKMWRDKTKERTRRKSAAKLWRRKHAVHMHDKAVAVSAGDAWAEKIGKHTMHSEEQRRQKEEEEAARKAEEEDNIRKAAIRDAVSKTGRKLGRVAIMGKGGSLKVPRRGSMRRGSSTDKPSKDGEPVRPKSRVEEPPRPDMITPTPDDPENGREAWAARIIAACKKGDWPTVDNLAQRLAPRSIDTALVTATHGWTPVMFATKENRVNIVERLLDIGYEVNAHAKVSSGRI